MLNKKDSDAKSKGLNGIIKGGTDLLKDTIGKIAGKTTKDEKDTEKNINEKKENESNGLINGIKNTIEKGTEGIKNTIEKGTEGIKNTKDKIDKDVCLIKKIINIIKKIKSIGDFIINLITLFKNLFCKIINIFKPKKENKK